ncbi:MAG: hypothetical protein PVJ57_21355 [Phycisphaerae bacterium]|jgi:hypothetical protein
MSEKPAQDDHVRDARGRRMTLLDPLTLHLLRRHDVVPAEPLSQIVQEIGPGMPRWQYRAYLASAVAFLACFIFLVAWKLMRRRPMDLLERCLWPFNVAAFAFSAFMTWRHARATRGRHVRRVMLAHQRCPHCGYDLRGLPSDPTDGATICPECGCAWQLPACAATGC